MPPIRSYTNWNTRPSNNEEQIEPYKHYYFICEGLNTERWYFERFIDMRKDFSISSLIHVEYLEKTEEHEGWSNPKKLCQLSNIVRTSGHYDFDPKRDVMILVFDADIYEAQDESVYNTLIENAERENTICVTNPSFELFLLLHYEHSYDELILPNSTAILKNDWVTVADGEEVRYIENLFRQKSGLKPKQDAEIATLVENVTIAIDQEKRLNNDIHLCRGRITSNIGLVIQQILSDTYGIE